MAEANIEDKLIAWLNNLGYEYIKEAVRIGGVILSLPSIPNTFKLRANKVMSCLNLDTK